jgi:hypothetical protein
MQDILLNIEKFPQTINIPRRRATGYVVLKKYLDSGLIPLKPPPIGGGTKPSPRIQYFPALFVYYVVFCKKQEYYT